MTARAAQQVPSQAKSGDSAGPDSPGRQNSRRSCSRHLASQRRARAAQWSADSGPPLCMTGSGLSFLARMVRVRAPPDSRDSPCPSGSHFTSHRSLAEPLCPAVKLALRLPRPSPAILCVRFTQLGPQDSCPGYGGHVQRPVGVETQVQSPRLA